MHKSNSFKMKVHASVTPTAFKSLKKNSNSSNTPYMLEAMLPLNRGKS